MTVRRHVVVLVLSVAAIAGAFVATLLSDNRPVLGLDLQGGISIVLFPEEGQDLSALDTAADIIRNRVDALGIAEPEIRRQGDTVVVDLPGVEERRQAEELVGQTAELRFRPVLATLPWGAAVGPSDTTVPPDTTAAPDTTTTAPAEPSTTCDELVTPRDERDDDATVWLRGDDADDDGEPDACYQLGPTVLTGRNVSGADSEYLQHQSAYVVNVEFKTDEFVENVATPYVGQQVAIELDGVVVSAPVINPGITGRDVVITGTFTSSEARDLALVLRYGALPIQFDEGEKTVQSISPTLGRDQLRAGVVAGLVGLGLVALYMIAYYRLLGLVVWVGLALTALVFFSLVSYLSARYGLTLTLAGVTGLIVSVGVTVDSYVVYFERLKDEVRNGKTIRSALDTGFRRAFRTIVAADLVALLGAGALWALAEGSVRGFAFFLGLSTLIDLGISYFVMHPTVALMARRPALVRMRGVGIASGLDVVGARV